MKYIKTTLLSLLAIVTSIEMSYPIILTGPGRRQAHRKQTEEAYAAGMMAESDQNLNDDPALAENYAEDAVVQIQSAGDGSFLAKFSNATPEERAALLAQATPEQKAALQARHNSVKTQSIQSNDNQSDDSAVYQALQDAGLDDDLEASNVAIQAIESEEKAAETDTPVVQTVQAVSSSVSPLIKRTQTSAAPVAKTQVIPIISSPAVPLITTPQTPQVTPVRSVPEVKVTEPTKSSEQAKTSTDKPANKEIAMSTTVDKEIIADEATKIVKVYPVYDAIRSAMRHIYSAAEDMINYTYSLVTTSTKPAVSDVKISITEK